MPLFDRYEGKKIADDTQEYLENFNRIVHLLGKSFPNLGIEILLHDLSNPSRSLVALENNVTGRQLHLRDHQPRHRPKKGRDANENKLNYELNLGARKFSGPRFPSFEKSMAWSEPSASTLTPTISPKTCLAPPKK